MPKNTFFNTTSAVNEQRLLASLIEECIQITGENVVYLPRNLVALDNFFLEDALSKYQDAFLMEAYQDIEPYGYGNTQFLSKFGIVNKDKTTFIIAKNTFDRLILLNTLSAFRPLEGDLIYQIQSSELFQVTFVEDENPFRMLGDIQTYRVSCEAYKYSHQRISPTDYDIDAQVNEESAEIKLYLNTPIFGDFIINEIITSGTTTAKVTAWDAVEASLTIIDRNGTFTTNTLVIGGSSGVSSTIREFSTVNNTNDILEINEFLQQIGDTLINNKTSNITGEIVTNTFMADF